MKFTKDSLPKDPSSCALLDFHYAYKMMREFHLWLVTI